MKQLTLIRHAKSSWSHSGLSDFERPLNTRGERDAPQMGQRLSQRQLSINGIVSSPAKRAISTAHIIAQALGFGAKNILEEPRIYEAMLGTLVAVVQDLDDSREHVLLFGHNPGLTELSFYLSGQRLENLPTCGMFSMQFDLQHWADIQPSSGELVFFDYPKNREEEV